jgi:hypothetical protein
MMVRENSLNSGTYEVVLRQFLPQTVFVSIVSRTSTRLGTQSSLRTAWGRAEESRVLNSG